MIIDAQTMLSDAQALSATGVSTNTYDSGLAKNNTPPGEPMCILFTIDAAANAGDGDETYKFGLIQSANADLSSADVLVETNTSLLTRTLLVAGFKFALPYPTHLKTKRYLGAAYTLGGTTPSITVTAMLVPLSFVQNEQYFAKNFTISS